MSTIRSIENFRHIAIKVGSSLLVDSSEGKLRREWLKSLAADIADLHKGGRDILIISSGAVALGRALLNLPVDGLNLEDSQAAASIGQIALARDWSEVLSDHGITTGQVLMTHGDTEERERYLNVRSTIAKLLEWRSVPVINENDTVATAEIRYGDNDRLAARLATMMNVDLLVLLSDVDGLYDRSPEHGNGRLIPVVERITSEIEDMAGPANSPHSRGGMKTKIEAGKMATMAGVHMLIASGRKNNPLRAVAEGGPCTWFLTSGNPITAKKKWIAGSLEIKGAITIDAGAMIALRSGKSLLSAGVTFVRGSFKRGDAVSIRDSDGHEVGRGLIRYDAEDAIKIKG